MIDNAFVRITEQDFDKLDSCCVFNDNHNNIERNLCDTHCITYSYFNNNTYAIKSEFTNNKFFATKNTLKILESL